MRAPTTAAWAAKVLVAVVELGLAACVLGVSLAWPLLRDGGAAAVAACGAALEWLVARGPAALAAAAFAPPQPSSDVTCAKELLRVHFDDKEAAKPLGARWDTELKLWYVPVGLPVGNRDKLVARWGLSSASRVAAQARLDAAAAAAETSGATHAIPAPSAAPSRFLSVPPAPPPDADDDLVVAPRRAATSSSGMVTQAPRATAAATVTVRSAAAAAAPSRPLVVLQPVFRVPFGRRDEAQRLGGIWRDDKHGYTTATPEAAAAMRRAGFEVMPP